ncbi:MAG: L-threonylcarbamoyladenylate synthase [Deltaproteobacteria bacterium]|nr:L-threonylcarbamoyladenylate synthase [Deltaproteobacteria bacterium]MBN2670299.1 L-threonylcarbamoyladenylate synthase [Deltaproteobacteria bacterium]
MSATHIPSDADWLKQAATVVESGGVVALAFERLFGLAANALDESAVARSAAIKDRPTHDMGQKPISVILPSIEMCAMVSTGLSDKAYRLAQKYWPGPLTLLIAAKPGLPRPLIGPGGLIGVRVPGPSPALDLARATGKVLTATSANRKGAAEPTESKELISLEGVDLVVDGTVLGPPGSTIVAASDDRLTILRQGVLHLSAGEL